MNISIDDRYLDLCDYNGQKVTISELLACLIVINGEHPNDVMDSLINKGIVIKDFYDNNIYYVHSDFQLKLKSFLLQSDKDVPEITELAILVTKLQELFPKERKPDVNGVPKYAYRGNKVDVTTRLQKFFKLYGKYSYDDVYECTKRYVESFKYDKTYMKILPYYIMKDGESQLATELENMEDDPQEVTNPNEDWTNTLL